MGQAEEEPGVAGRSNGTGPPTQADVARRAGVSRALVSIVFRDLPGASPSNRDHIRAVAAEIGYLPDQRAQLLGRKRTGVLGVCYSLTHDFHGTMVEQLYAAAEQQGFGLVLSGFGTSRSEETAITSLLAYRCEGLVLVGSGARLPLLERVARQVPTVVALRGVRRPYVGVVRSDDLLGSRSATGHLLELGHRRLLHIDGVRAAGAADRRRGFRTAVELARADGAELAGGSTEADGVRAGERLVERLGEPDRPTGVVVFNDHAAVGVLAAVRRAGFRVPQDLSVVGFDDARLAGVPGVDLSTVRQDTVTLARSAIAQLGARSADPAVTASETVVRPELVVRGTTGPPPGD